MNYNLNKRRISKLVFFLSFILILAGCKSKKMSVVDDAGYLKSKSHQEVLDDVLTKELNYKTITTKGKVSFRGKSYNAVFKLIKDEYIQVSVRAPLINIEAVRINISPEKIVVIDRLIGKRYAELDMKSTGVDFMVAFNFYNLQALLTNQLFVAGNDKVKEADYSKFKLSVNDNRFILQTQDRNKITYNFAVDASDRIVSTAIANSTKAVGVLWEYRDFVKDQEYVYPTSMKGIVSAKKKKIEFGVSYSSLDINTDFEIDKTVSGKYKKVQFLDLIKAFTKLM